MLSFIQGAMLTFSVRKFSPMRQILRITSEQIETSFKIIDRLPLESRGKELFRDISQFMVDRQT